MDTYNERSLLLFSVSQRHSFVMLGKHIYNFGAYYSVMGTWPPLGNGKAGLSRGVACR